MNDDAGQTWTRDVDVTAPTLRARSPIGSTCPTRSWQLHRYGNRSDRQGDDNFTDGNVKFVVAPTGTTAQFVETLYMTATNCSGAVKNGYPKTLNGEDSDTVGLRGNESSDWTLQLRSGRRLQPWSTTNGATFTTIARNKRSVGFASPATKAGIPDLVAHYLHSTQLPRRSPTRSP